MTQVRKTFCIQVNGIEVTAGADFFKGRSANVELCHCLNALKNAPELTPYSLELVSLHGGSVVSNVPGHSEALITIAADGTELLLKMLSERKPYIPDTTYSVAEVTK